MDEMYEIAFNLILSAGNSKSNAMMAIQAAREYRFTDAQQYIKQAQSELTQAHQIQTELIQKEAQGNPCQPNLMMIHAQDHLVMALMALDNAREMALMYQMIEKLTEDRKEQSYE